MASNKTSLIAAGTTLVGIVIGVLVASPGQWRESLSEWVGIFSIVISATWPIFVGAICAGLGLLLGRFVFPDPSRIIGAQTNIMYEADFSGHLQKLAGEHNITRIDYLGYTNETAADVVKYEYRNQEGLLIRVLSRNWQDERTDEIAYNLRLSGSKTRRWAKAETIEQIALAPWHHAGSREQRFYWGLHPLIKAILVYCDGSVLAFLTVYDWQEWPHDGGSPFKGANHVGICLDSRSPKDKTLIGYLSNQFKFHWEYKSHDAQDAKPHGYQSVFSLTKDDAAPG